MGGGKKKKRKKKKRKKREEEKCWLITETRSMMKGTERLSINERDFARGEYDGSEDRLG